MKHRYKDPCLGGILIIIRCLIFISLVGLKRVRGGAFIPSSNKVYFSNKRDELGGNRFLNSVSLRLRGSTINFLNYNRINRVGIRSLSTGRTNSKFQVEVKITDLETNITINYESIAKAAKAINTTVKSLTQYINTPGLGGIKLPYRDRYFIVSGRYSTTTTFRNPNSTIFKNSVKVFNDPVNERKLILKETQGKTGVYA
jgi:hypothetical protein